VNSVPVGLPGSRERIDFGYEIGMNADPAGNTSPTTVGILHYAKDGVHVVPGRPSAP
jgi:Bacterial toxin 50